MKNNLLYFTKWILLINLLNEHASKFLFKEEQFWYSQIYEPQDSLKWNRIYTSSNTTILYFIYWINGDWLFYVFIFTFNSLRVSSTSCLSSGETNYVNTTSGSCRWRCRVQVGSELPTCTRHGHRHSVTVTRGCIDTICFSWWWARGARNM